jgi:hypothetical protein
MQGSGFSDGQAASCAPPSFALPPAPVAAPPSWLPPPPAPPAPFPPAPAAPFPPVPATPVALAPAAPVALAPAAPVALAPAAPVALAPAAPVAPAPPDDPAAAPSGFGAPPDAPPQPPITAAISAPATTKERVGFVTVPFLVEVWPAGYDTGHSMAGGNEAPGSGNVSVRMAADSRPSSVSPLSVLTAKMATKLRGRRI